MNQGIIPNLKNGVMPYFYKINNQEYRINSPEYYDLLRRTLVSYNAQKFTSNELQVRIGYIPEHRRDWMLTNMCDLQDKANIYELLAFGVLLGHKINFLHQAPLCIHGKPYFLDFYIPSMKTAIEIDGRSHQSKSAMLYDSNRDKDISAIGIRVIRVPNGIAYSPLSFESCLMECGVIPVGPMLFRPYKRPMNDKERKQYQEYKRLKNKNHGKV